MPSVIEAEELRGEIARSNQAINTAKVKLVRARAQVDTLRSQLEQLSEDINLKWARRAEMKAAADVSLHEYRDVMETIAAGEDMIETIQTDLGRFLVAIQESEAEIKACETARIKAQSKLEVKAPVVQFPAVQS